MITMSGLLGWALRSSILILIAAVMLKALRVKDPSVRLAAAGRLAASPERPHRSRDDLGKIRESVHS
jgi:hypothetical protein